MRTSSINIFRMVLLALSIPFSLFTNAQDKGQVLDATTRNPLAGVSILSANSNQSATTGGEGVFTLPHGMAGDTLRFSHIGYKTLTIPYPELKRSDYIILLSKEEQSLSEVTVSASPTSLQALLHYKELSPMPVGLYSFGAAMQDDKIYISGGDASFIENAIIKSFIDYGDSSLDHTHSSNTLIKNIKPNGSFYNYNDKIYVYDTRTDQWKTLSPKITKRAYLNSNYFDGKIYSMGGKRLSKNRKLEYLSEVIEAYDIRRDTIFTSKINPHQAINFASVVYEDNIIVMGGSVSKNANDQKVYSNKVYLFNLKTGLWFQLDDMPNAKETRGIIVDNSIYLIGGLNVAPLRSIESYNVSSGKWTSEAKLIREVERPGLAYHADIIYIFDDGCIQSYDIATKEVKLYKVDLPLRFAELFYSDSKLYIVGGFRQDDYKYRTEPSAGVYTIGLYEFEKTMTYNE